MLLDFWEDFGLIAAIIVFFAIYNAMSNSFIRNGVIALLVTVIIFFMVVVPYDWFKYLLFVVLFLYGIFSTVRPEEW